MDAPSTGARGDRTVDAGVNEANRLAAELLAELRALGEAKAVKALSGFILGVRDGALDQAAMVCDARGDSVSAARIRARKSGEHDHAALCEPMERGA
jgi:hypothetical protein